MLHEFAVEPECFENCWNFRYLTENFGVSHGRLISDFPETWNTQLRKVIESSPWTKGLQLTEKILYIKKHALIRSARDYDSSHTWTENAVTQHQSGKPFHAIVVRDSTNQPDFVLSADSLDNTNPKWKTSRDKRILRTAAKLGNAVRLLLQMSEQIYFVDKMFADQLNATGKDKDRWLVPLVRFIQIATEGRDIPPEFEYHSEGRILSLDEKTKFEDNCKSALKKVLPTGSSIKLKLWTDRSVGKDFFHARYILTERGGIRIDWGLDQSKSGEKTEQKTDVSLLDHDMWDELWRLFQRDSKTFQLLDYNIESSN
jgi:hypothetical protein